MRKLAHPMWKLVYLLLALAALWAVQAISQEPPPSNPEPNQPAKPAEQAFKNIQVLKGMPSSQLMGVMQSFSRSLGVKCDFCHVMGAFDKDDKQEKKTARKMMLMARQINTDNFGGHMTVTCWTCHRGSSEPESAPHQAEPPK